MRLRAVSSESPPRGIWLEVGDAVAELIAAPDVFHSFDLRRNEKRCFSRRIGRGNLDLCIHGKVAAAAETEAPLRDVLTLDNLIGVNGVAHTSAEIDADAHVAPAVYRPPGGVQSARQIFL